MEKTTKKSIVVIALLLLMCITGGLLYTNSKYTTTVDGSVSASVAKWVFQVTGNDSYSTTDTIENLTLAQTVDEKTLVNGKIAPGTSGSFDIVIDTTGAEVGVKYDVTFANNSGKDLPTNLIFKLDGKDWTMDNGISGTIDANATSKTVTHTIAWSWAYETDDIAVNDPIDTADGVNAFSYTFDVTAVGTQVQPVAK